MLKEILTQVYFEFKTRSRSLSSYIYFLLFFSVTVLMTLAAGGAFSGIIVSFGSSSRVFINAPLRIASFVAICTTFSLFLIAPVFGQAICKDFINNMDQIIFTTPLKVRRFLLGRFLGALLFMLFILSSIPLGVFVASLLPFALPSSLGPQFLLGYIAPLFNVALPSVFIFGSLFFLMGSQTKKMTPIYIAATLLVLLWLSSGKLLSELDNRTLASLLDPMGLNAIDETTRYWSVDQQNTKSLVFESYYLLNRLLWLGLGVIALLYSLFFFSTEPQKDKKRKSKVTVQIKTESLPKLKPLSLYGSPISWWAIFKKQLSFDFFQTVKSIYFLVLLLAGVGYMFVVGTQIGKIFGTNTYPVTYNVLDFVGGSFNLFMLIIITLYSGETIWRDRDLKINQIIDAIPVPNSVLFVAKYINMILITALLLTSVMIAGVLIQASYGYFNFEWSQYLTRLYLIELPSYINLISLALFLQVVCRNKYIGHGVMVLFYVFYSFASAMGFPHYLYRFSATPTPTYSDMNGFGHVFKIFHLYNTYWLFLSLLLALLTWLFWQRGTTQFTFKEMILNGLSQTTRPFKIVFSLSLFGFVAMGSFLFYQTNIVNKYQTTKDLEKLSYAYEKDYKVFENKARPELTSVFAKVDIYPEELKAKAQLQLKYKNNTNSPITEFIVHYPNEKWTMNFSVPTTMTENKNYPLVVYQLETALQPGDEFSAEYSVDVDQSTIENGSNIGKIHYNGTFFNNHDFFPIMGYVSGLELSARKTREKYGLQPKPRKASIDDLSQTQFNYIGPDTTWIDFETIVSTSSDQIAIAPGYLQKEWQEGGRRYFHYKMDQKILNFYAFLSGRYELKTDQWNDVKIEIYYQKGHEYNLDRMIKGTKKSFDYFTQNFSPYQHKQFRIIEFPRYETFAQAFPNTIPFSEAIGFIAKVNDTDPDDVDYPFYVTSHELAHQWWAHQLIGANVQGSEMLSETFSQYSALMVMEKEYGREKMKRFLKHELDRYLQGRGQEGEYENPLYLTEQQSYIHYRKGSVIFYALKDYLGEEVINSAIQETLQKHGLRKPPYPTTKDFLALLKSKVKPEQVSLVEDMLEKIVLFENRPLLAEATETKDQVYKVELKVFSKKIDSDPQGKETEQKQFQQEMDIGVLDEKNQYLYLKKHPIKAGENTFEIEVKGKPIKAGIDPLNILIDRDSNDNLINVSVKKTQPSQNRESTKN